MSTNPNTLVTCISEVLAELAENEQNMMKLLKLNSAHYLLAKLAKTLATDERVNIEA